jgi:hypothetical protein
MANVKKEFINDHWLGCDIVVEFEQVSGELTITSYAKNTGRRRFEQVKLNAIQSMGLKEMLSEKY